MDTDPSNPSEPVPEAGSTVRDERSALRRFNHTPLGDLLRGRITGREDWQWRVESSGLPEHAKALLIKLIRQSKLFPPEQNATADRLVLELETKLADGQALAEAIGPYKDVRAAAKAIHREAKRQRSWWWKVGQRISQAILSLVGFYFVAGLYLTFFTAPQMSVDYAALLNEEAAAVPEADRAWPVLREALLAMDIPRVNSQDWAEDDSTPRVDLGAGPDGEHWGFTAEYLASHPGPIGQIRRGASMPGLGYVAGYQWDHADLPLLDHDRDPADLDRETAAFDRWYADREPPASAIMLPHLGTLRTVARVLGDDAMRAAQAGDAETTTEDLLALFDLAGHADEQKMLINQMVTISIWALGLERTSRVVVDHPDLLSDDQLGRLGARIAATRRYRIDYSGEKLQIDDHIQRLYTNNGRGNGHVDFVAMHRWAADLDFSWDEDAADPPGPVVLHAISIVASPAYAAVTADRAEVTELVDRVFALYAAEANVPIWAQPESKAEAELERVLEGSNYAAIRYFPLSTYLPHIGAMRTTKTRYDAMAHGAAAGVSLERYRREHGRYPDTLDALVPGYLAELPIDPINGEPMRYRLIEGRPLLYSLGTDRDDDGGRWPRKADGEIYLHACSWDTDDDPPDGDWLVWPRYEGAYEAPAPNEKD